MVGPASSYSSFPTHISSKVEREARIDPPIQTEYLKIVQPQWNKTSSVTFALVEQWSWSRFLQERVWSFRPTNVLQWMGTWWFLKNLERWKQKIQLFTSRQDGVLVKVFTNIDVALHDRIVSQLMNSAWFFTNEVWFEKDFRTSESSQKENQMHIKIKSIYSAPTVMTFPSGSSYCFSTSELSAAFAISAS